MPEWIIYYDDGSSFTSDEGPPQAAPKEGAQVVAVANQATGKILWHSAEAYCWHKEGEWVPHSVLGERRYLSLPDEPGIVVHGYAIPYARFEAIYNSAVDDPRMPFKTGRQPYEPEGPRDQFTDV